MGVRDDGKPDRRHANARPERKPPVRFARWRSSAIAVGCARPSVRGRWSSGLPTGWTTSPRFHLTARDLFAPPRLPAHECLIHPLRFAEQVIALRATRQRNAAQQRAVLTALRVFRGPPSNARDPYVYGISQRQRSEWTRDKRVDVVYRTLRYPPDWPNKPPREKGVDVLVALKVVRAALDPRLTSSSSLPTTPTSNQPLRSPSTMVSPRSRLPGGAAHVSSARAVRASGTPPSTQPTWTRPETDSTMHHPGAR